MYYITNLGREALHDWLSTSFPLQDSCVPILVLPFHALAYGELRLLLNSVWPVWLLHNAANAISLPLISAGFVVIRTDF